MNTNENHENSNRRSFLGSVAAGAAALGLTTMAPGLSAFAGESNFNTDVYGDPDAWFNQLKGKHRIVFDSPHPHEIYPFAWPRVFLLTNEATGTKNSDCGVVVVLRHASIGYAMEDRVWAKYQLGKVFEANDPETKTFATRNPFWKPKAGAFTVPGIGEILIGINQLQESGVMFCVCAAAINVYSAALTAGSNQKHEDVKKELTDALLPGIQPVPSGVWALGRAQEKGCGYIFAG